MNTLLSKPRSTLSDEQRESDLKSGKDGIRFFFNKWGGRLKFRISRHAEEEIERRTVPRRFVDATLENPQQVVGEYGNKEHINRKLALERVKYIYLRVIVNESVDPKAVVTIYKTSKIMKYWSES